MFRSSKRFFSCKMILSSSVPCRRERLDVIQLCAVIIGLPVSLFRLSYEVVSCRAVAVCLVGWPNNSHELSRFVITVEDRFLSWPSSVWESVMVCLQLRLSIRL